MTGKQALVSRSELRAALALACKITERRATCPILSNVALLSTGAALALQATDCDIQATFSLDGSFADDGFATTIAAHAFRDVEKKAPDSADATIATGADETRASIAFGALNIGIPSIDVTDWPVMTIEGEIRADAQIQRAAFLDALEFVSGAISTEETRYYLNGIFMHAATDDAGAPVLRMVATDGHRLRVRDIAADMIGGAIDGLPHERGVIIPRKTVLFLMDVCKRKGAPDSVGLIVNSVKARFTSGNVDVITKLIDGTFPGYGRVIPVKNEKRLTVDVKALAEAVKAVSCMSAEKASGCRFTARASSLRLDVNTPDYGSADTTIPATFDGGDEWPFEIGFNAAYVLAELAMLDSESVTFMLNDSGSPALIYGGDVKGAAFSVLMPMRV